MGFKNFRGVENFLGGEKFSGGGVEIFSGGG